jgi:hypothetical protein
METPWRLRIWPDTIDRSALLCFADAALEYFETLTALPQAGFDEGTDLKSGAAQNYEHETDACQRFFVIKPIVTAYQKRQQYKLRAAGTRGSGVFGRRYTPASQSHCLLSAGAHFAHYCL